MQFRSMSDDIVAVPCRGLHMEEIPAIEDSTNTVIFGESTDLSEVAPNLGGVIPPP